MTRTISVVLAIGALLAVATPSGAGTPQGPPVFELLAKAHPDECFGGVGAPYVPKAPGEPCPEGRRPKANQADLSALTKARGDLWLGTAANTLCLELGEATARFGPAAVLNDAWACEFGASGFRASLPDPSVLPARLGDWRPPRLYRVRGERGTLEDLGAHLSGADRARLDATLAIRGAGALGRTVLFAGPALGPGGIAAPPAVNVFAFDAAGGRPIGSATLPEYTDARGWIAARGGLYAAVGTPGGGAVVRWTGDASAPLNFEVVGTLPAAGVDLAAHRGRLYVTTSPAGEGTVATGVYRTAPLGADGLPASSVPLEEVWNAADYEPDPVTATTYRGGAIASFHGRLVWGTTNEPFAGVEAYARAHGDPGGGPLPLDQLLAAVDRTRRPTALFSADHLEGSRPRVHVLYGSAELPVYDPATGWHLAPNAAGARPELGEAGFGNPFNAATTAMVTTQGRLYVGTLDWTYQFSTAITGLLSQIVDAPLERLDVPDRRFGGDLLELTSLRRPALQPSRAGAGALANEGIVTLLADGERTYLGTANRMNLLPEGGWELRGVTAGIVVQRR